MKKPAPANAKFYPIPAFALGKGCNGKECMETVYFVRSPLTNKPVPVSCDVEGTYPPKGKLDGQGISHFQTCPNANDFTRKKK